MLDLKNATDNNEFWKTVQPYLSHNVTTFLKVSQVKKGEIISAESKVANSFSNFFENAIRSLNIRANEHSQENYDLKNPIEIAIKLLIINLINKNITNNENFHFSPGDYENILKEIINLDNKKNGTFKNIPTRLLKDVSDVCSPILANIWNEEIQLNKSFLENLKLADVTPIFKKKDKTFIENYRPDRSTNSC